MASWVPEKHPAGVHPDSKPAKRYRASQRETAVLKEQFQDAFCRVCGDRPTELHHVVPRSQGGDDVSENYIPLCRRHHTMLEDHSPGWLTVAAYVHCYVMARESRLSYVRAKIGMARFSRRYPTPSFLMIQDIVRYHNPDRSLSEPGSHGAQGEPATGVSTVLRPDETASGSENDQEEVPWP